jgi:hypothetical protein
MKKYLVAMLVCGYFAFFVNATAVQAAEAKKEAAKPAAAPHAAEPVGAPHGAIAPHAPNAAEHHEAVKGHELARGHEGERGHEALRAHHEFHEHDVHRFNHAELARWRGGRWKNTCFNGRCGNWWFTGGQWYFYERAVYPYPIAVAEVTYLEPLAVAPVAAAAQPVPLRVAPAAAAQVWYYCDNPPGYYPYVQQCSTQFREVAAKAAGH